MKPRIGFIGLGLMGAPMSKRLLKAGYTVAVWNRTPSRCKSLIKAGAVLAKTPSDVAAQSDVVITMVTGPRDVGEVLFGRHGVVDGAHAGLTVIDMSTIGRQAAVGIADALSDYGIDFLDAPVTGSTPAAEAGTLIIMVGGAPRVFKRCEKILREMGALNHMGPVGMGQLIKLAQNMIGAAEVSVLGEALALCEAYGLPAKRVGEVLATTGIASPLIKMKIPAMVKRKYDTLFSLTNMHKDLKLGQQEARRAGLKLRVGKSAEMVHDLAMRAGGASKDYSVVREVVRSMPSRRS
jgi:3-hydroxyisobutyrate dehydrogenase-like beta-hydroxyacid dehydrogenase